MKQKQFKIYSFFTKRAGGFGRKLALTLLRGEGLDARPCPNPRAPVAETWKTSVIVYGDKRVQRKAERILNSY